MFSLPQYNSPSNEKKRSRQGFTLMRLPFFSNEKKRSRQGFTLIELMIAIAVVAVLSTVGLVVYSGGQRLARDSKRKADLKQIHNSLAIFYTDNKRFPQTPANDSTVNSDSASAIWLVDTPPSGTAIVFNKSYIDALPKDPLNNTTYRYSYLSPNDGYNTCAAGTFFILSATLENTSDKDTYAKAPYSICGYATTDAQMTALNNSYVIFQGP